MKKHYLLLCAAILLTMILSGCAKAKSGSAEPEGVYVRYNGTNITAGMKYEDVKDGLGEESRTPEVILPCDGGDAYKDTMHFYPGFVVTENIDGVISEMEITDMYDAGGDAMVNGKVKVGDNQATVIEALGEPDIYPIPEDDYSMTYTNGNQLTLLFLDPDNKDIVNDIMFTLREN